MQTTKIKTKIKSIADQLPRSDIFDYPGKKNVCRTHHIFKNALVKIELESDPVSERPRIFWTKVCRKCMQIFRE